MKAQETYPHTPLLILDINLDIAYNILLPISLLVILSVTPYSLYREIVKCIFIIFAILVKNWLQKNQSRL